MLRAYGRKVISSSRAMSLFGSRPNLKKEKHLLVDGLSCFELKLEFLPSGRELPAEL